MESSATKIVRKLLCTILSLLSIFFIFIGILNVYFYFNYKVTYVRGFSMLPTINSNVERDNEAGDKIFINMKTKSIMSNDIVVAHVDWFEHEIIKRVVGTPFDRIEIQDQVNHYDVFVNDKLLYSKEKYGIDNEDEKTGSIGYYAKYLQFFDLETNPQNAKNIKEFNGKKYIVLNENEFFLMGDNWGHTTDSIEKGPAKRSEIIGKVDYIFDIENDNLFVETWFMLSKVFKFDL